MEHSRAKILGPGLGEKNNELKAELQNMVELVIRVTNELHSSARFHNDPRHSGPRWRQCHNWVCQDALKRIQGLADYMLPNNPHALRQVPGQPTHAPEDHQVSAPGFGLVVPTSLCDRAPKVANFWVISVCEKLWYNLRDSRGRSQRLDRPRDSHFGRRRAHLSSLSCHAGAWTVYPGPSQHNLKGAPPMPTLALLIVICAGVFYGARMMLPVQPGESEFGDEY